MPRSVREIAFRLRQEAADLYLYAAQPALPADIQPPALALPDAARVAARLRGSAFAAQVEQLAEEILRHRFPVLGLTLETGPQIEWRKDYLHGPSTQPVYFRRIPYLDFARVGDHKMIWELSRHQHLVVLAQAALFTGRPDLTGEIVTQLEGWMEQNPFQCGIHWTSALEVAFRALSWIWIWHFAGAAMPPVFQRRFLTALYRHGLHLRHNLSVYFSANTHLLGEAVALHALGLLFPAFPGAARWRSLGRKITLEQMDFQVQEDGTHFEHSSYYHVYALDMFLLHHILEPAPYTSKLQLMASYLDALLGPARKLVSLGDDDGGRLFFPYGPRDEFGRATLATCAALFPGQPWYWQPPDLAPQAAWWLGEQILALQPAAVKPDGSRLFRQSGVAVLNAAPAQVLVDAGPLGYAGAGHSHADTLSITARLGEEEVLIDPGTFTYVGDPRWRDWFRGSAAHNTIRVDGADQAVTAGPFRWAGKPAVRILAWTARDDFDYLDAECLTAFRHRRRVLFLKPALVFVLDEIDGPAGEHIVEQFWHLGDAAARRRILFPESLAPEFSEGDPHGWRSPVFGVRLPTPVIRVVRTAVLPALLPAVIDLAPQPRLARVDLCAETNGGWRIQWEGERTIRAGFSNEGGWVDLA